MRLSGGTDKSFLPLWFVWWLVLLYRCLYMFKGFSPCCSHFLSGRTDIPSFLLRCFEVISDVLGPWKKLIFLLQMDRTLSIFHIHVHICIYIFMIKFVHFFWNSYKTSVVSRGLHVLNLVSLEVPLPHCNAFGLCPQILFLPWASAAMWRRCDVTDGVCWLAASMLID